jgi:PAS domain S-box-containing protein
MDVEIFARQIQDAQARVDSLMQQVENEPIKGHWALENAFAELNTTFEELNTVQEELHSQQTELLANQAQIQVAQQHYRDLFDFAPDSYLVTDERGIIREVNRAAAALLNIDTRLSSGLPLTIFVAKDQISGFLEQLQQLRKAATGVIHERQFWIQPRDAPPLPVLARITPIVDRAGQVLGLRWLLRELTDQSDRAGWQSNTNAQPFQRLHQAFIQSPAMIAVTRGPEHRFEFANPMLLRALNRSAEEIIGYAAREVLAGHEDQLGYRSFDQVYRSGQSHSIEAQRILLDRPGSSGSEEAFFTYQISPLCDDNNRIDGLLIHGVEVTAQVQRLRHSETQARQLAQERTRLTAVLQHLPTGVVIAEAPSGRLLLSNVQTETILHGSLPLGEAFGSYRYNGFYPDGRRYSLDEWPLARAIWLGETVLDEEIEVVRGDGTSATIRFSATPIRDEHEQIVAAVSTFYDITEQRRAERTLHDSEARLRAILDSADQSVVLIAPDYSIQAFNRFAAEGGRAVFGVEMRIGGSILDYVLPEHLEGFMRHFQQALDGKHIMVELQIRGLSHSDWWEFHYYPIKLSSGAVTGVTFNSRNITVRKQAETALRESEERLRLALEAGQMGHWDWNILTGDVAWSPDHNRMLGLPVDQARGNYAQFMERIHPEDRARIAGALSRSQAEQQPYQEEFRAIWPDGSIHWIAGDGRVYADGDGRSVRMIGVTRDITERKQAEADLQVAQERLRTVIANVPVILWAINRDGVFTLSEGKGLAALQLQPGEVVGRSVYEVYASQPALLEKIRQALAGERQTWTHPVEGLLFDTQVTQLRDERGRVAGLIGVSTDITERNRAETGLSLLASANYLLSTSLDYETTLARVAQLAVPSFADLCLVSIQRTEAATDRIEVAVADAIPAGHLDAIKQLVSDGWRTLIKQAIRRDEPILLANLAQSHSDPLAFDAQHQRLVQALSLQSLMILPLQVREHNIGALIIGATRERQPYDQTDLAFARELAYRIALAVDNAQLYRDAQAAIAARDTFLSIASHELKTPLTSMLGYAYLLKRPASQDGINTERTRQAVDVIVRQTQRLNRIIEDMLDLSRIQRGQWDLARQPLNLVPLLQRAVEEAQLTTQRHMIQLRCSFNELPVNGDELRLEQVIQNLLSNAVKYSPGGGRILVACEIHDQLLQIRVSDPGIGVPQAAQARLWEPFYRAGNVGAYSSGFGIGLYLAHEIVTRHNGTIAVESEEGEGSTFVVTLPLLTDSAET